MYAYFNYIHILYILSFFVLLVVFYLLLKSKSQRTQKTVLLLLVLISAIFEFSDTFGYLKFGYRTLFYNLPLFACDLNIFILPLVILRTGKKEILNKFILY